MRLFRHPPRNDAFQRAAAPKLCRRDADLSGLIRPIVRIADRDGHDPCALIACVEVQFVVTIKFGQPKIEEQFQP
jgi:hypothetical protein